VFQIYDVLGHPCDDSSFVHGCFLDYRYDSDFGCSCEMVSESDRQRCVYGCCWFSLDERYNYVQHERDCVAAQKDEQCTLVLGTANMVIVAHVVVDALRDTALIPLSSAA
jgi:hypothetical protein